MPLGISTGLVPIGFISGAPWTNKFNYDYQIAPGNGTPTNIFQYDLVYRNPTTGYITKYLPSNVSASNGTAPLGVFLGCQYFLSGSQQTILQGIAANFWPGGQVVASGSVVKAMVTDDPNIIYSITMDTNSVPNINYFGANATFSDPNVPTPTPNSLVNGESAIVLNTSSVARGPASNVSGVAAFNGTTNVVISVPGITANSAVNITPFSPMTGTFTITIQAGASFTIVSTSGADTMNFSYIVNSGNGDNSYLPLKIYSPNLSQNNPQFDPITGNGTAGMAINVLINNHAFKPGTQGV